MKVAVVGAGAWGTTLATIVSSRAETWLWAREAEVAAAICTQQANPWFLDGFTIPPTVHATCILGEALDDADVVVIAAPSQHVRDVVAPVAALVRPDATVLIATKGIELSTRRRMSEVIADVLADHDPGAIGCLSGPNLAREVMAAQPTATCVAFSDPSRAIAMRDLLMSDALRVYTSDDVVGCEIGGATKNVIAIAAGVADGLGYGMNTKASLVARGLAELSRFGVASGGRPLTFLGLAGLGDLVATCASPLSRNRILGELLGRGETLCAALSGFPTIPEGVPTATALVQMADAVDIELPIATVVHDLVRGDVTVHDMGPRLMLRPPTAELHGLDTHEEGRRDA
jgi:glycerol-3-phosphate dehydrogenase (NAD(P)+)